MAPDTVFSDDPAGGCVIRVKVVPGAGRDEIAGVLGDRLKVRVSAPAEGGKANAAVCAALAAALGARVRDVEVVSGHASPAKHIRVRGLGAAQAKRALNFKTE